MNSGSNQASLSFLLTIAFKEVFKNRELIIEHSFGSGYFCHDNDWKSFTAEELNDLKHEMENLIGNDIPLKLEEMAREQLKQHFINLKSVSKTENLSHWQEDPIPIIKFGTHLDYRLELMTSDKNKLGPFDIHKYNDGFMFRFPSILNPSKLQSFKNQPKLFSIMEEHEKWGDILGIRTINDLNLCVQRGEIHELAWVAEGLHEKKIAEIADLLVKGFPEKRIITIAGPSSSGKTTFAKRLAIQLRVNGYTTKLVSMDDYFHDRENIPRDSKGHQDFEGIQVMDTALLAERMDNLLKGRTIPSRRFDFESGRGRDLDSIKLEKREFVIIEGIHGLNPKLGESLGIDRIQRIYISAITQLNIDSTHRVSTSDNRLLRRLVRDTNFRSYAAENILERWDSVRRGEEKNIFPFQEKADLMFNS
ncbi:MAG: nucleoside kinase, partial [Candidatus Neomarinimicrobiota bacterium]